MSNDAHPLSTDESIIAGTSDTFRGAPISLLSERLSDRAKSVWAKTGGPTEWLPLYQHMIDSALVAERLFDSWLSEQVKHRWRDVGPAPGLMRTVAIFLAGAHDVGKASPAFVAQSEPLAQRVRDAGLPCRVMAELKQDRQALPHSLISQTSLLTWLTERGITLRRARALASVLGAHHGRPVLQEAEIQPRRRPEGSGGQPWEDVRDELLTWMADATGFSDLVASGVDLTLPIEVQVELSGFVIVADWLASNTRLFPLCERSGDGVPASLLTHRAQVGWDEIAMPAPWEPAATDPQASTFYQERFGKDTTFRPHAVQQKAFELATAHDVGLLFIETTTGGGKTEAALAAAEAIAARRGSQGLLIALPTQATTNAMFGRVVEWIDRLPAKPEDVSAWAVSLGHGKSRLNPKFAELIAEMQAFERSLPSTHQFSTMHDEDDKPSGSEAEHLCNVVAHQWFLSAKRRLLANFSVVTIDQLLMASLQRKHLMLAHIALSGKVVVIDEAHASDDYMNVYLDSTLSWLGAYGVPVIVLSATLTPERRRSMMAAYAPSRAAEIEGLTFDPARYPLITVVPRSGQQIVSHHVQERTPGRRVTWSWHSPEPDAIVSTLQHLVSEQGCALVIRNTVRDAQATASAIEDAGLGPVILTHAGFLAADRARNDEELIDLFGRTEHGARPHRAIVVSTQVVEQSLDVDFDVLITDLAPMDLLLQRIGREHRHARWRPEHLRQAHVHVLAEESTDSPPHATDGSRAVYGDHLLLRTAATLLDHGSEIRLPEDISPLVTKALGGEPVGPDSWQEQLLEASTEHQRLLTAQREKAATWCVLPWTPDDHRRHLGQWLETSMDYTEIQMGAAVRDTEPTLEVIVVPLTADESAAVSPPWLLDDPTQTETLDTSTMPSDDLSRRIASWSVRLPTFLTRFDIEAVIRAIDTDARTRRWKWRQHPLLKGELILPMKQLNEGSHTLTTELHVGERAYLLTYSPDRGLEVSKQ